MEEKKRIFMRKKIKEEKKNWFYAAVQPINKPKWKYTWISHNIKYNLKREKKEKVNRRERKQKKWYPQPTKYFMFTPKTVKNFFNFNTQPFNNKKKEKKK